MTGFSWLEFVLGQVSGFVLGLAGSFLSWWVLVHRIVPRIAFASFISKTEYDRTTGRKSYRIKIRNAGSRDLIDGAVVAVISIKGLRPELPETRIAYRLPLNLSGDTSLSLPVLRARSTRVFRIPLETSRDIGQSAYIPADLRRRCKKGELELEALMRLGDSRIRIFVAGSDSISGARKVFQSRDYRIDDIDEASFDGLERGRPAPPGGPPIASPDDR